MAASHLERVAHEQSGVDTSRPTGPTLLDTSRLLCPLCNKAGYGTIPPDLDQDIEQIETGI